MKVFFRLKDIDDIQVEMGWKGGHQKVQEHIICCNKEVIESMMNWGEDNGRKFWSDFKPEIIWETEPYYMITKCAIKLEMSEEMAVLFRLKFGDGDGNI